VRRLFITGLIGALATLPGSTLRQLSLDQMIQQSTLIVRGSVQPTNAQSHGSMIFSHYTVQVTETYKGPASGQPAGQIDIGVPGGMLSGAIQRFAGAPNLSPTQDYVLFLWTSKSGLTQVIGLSQGLFSVISTPGTPPMVVRAAASERMLNAAGQPVADNDIRMALTDLKTHIQSVLSGQGAQ
jgi:hypothetical protein